MNHVNRRTGVRDSVTFSCPFCKCGTVTAGIDDDDCAVVIHTMPFCSKYIEDKEPALFLRDARLALKNRDRKLS